MTEPATQPHKALKLRVLIVHDKDENSLQVGTLTQPMSSERWKQFCQEWEAQVEAGPDERYEWREIEVLVPGGAMLDVVVAAVCEPESGSGEEAPEWTKFSSACAIRRHADCDGKSKPPADGCDCLCSCHKSDPAPSPEVGEGEKRCGGSGRCTEERRAPVTEERYRADLGRCPGCPDCQPEKGARMAIVKEAYWKCVCDSCDEPFPEGDWGGYMLSETESAAREQVTEYGGEIRDDGKVICSTCIDNNEVELGEAPPTAPASTEGER